MLNYTAKHIIIFDITIGSSAVTILSMSIT